MISAQRKKTKEETALQITIAKETEGVKTLYVKVILAVTMMIKNA